MISGTIINVHEAEPGSIHVARGETSRCTWLSISLGETQIHLFGRAEEEFLDAVAAYLMERRRAVI